MGNKAFFMFQKNLHCISMISDKSWDFEGCNDEKKRMKTQENSFPLTPSHFAQPTLFVMADIDEQHEIGVNLWG